ncbi:MAG TPA: TRAM domain-containing protein, partial [Candidatus Ratteibacteria bacterium]|nr:TRAM domain-containing protein [Candidatus Ratteibacteria bacterium]
KSRQICPEISLTSDIIVGFPGETEDDFNQTYNIIKEIKFDDLFVFKYSPRPKTLASKWDDSVSQIEKENRHKIILDLQDEISLMKNKDLVGKILDVLCLKESQKKQGFLIGRDIRKKVVLFKGEKNLIGKIVKVKITIGTRNYLLGELL